MAMKTDDCFTAALCVDCHREIDSGKTMTRQERRERMDLHILETIRQLAVKGLVKA